jgi:uncharacterized repeat protein (TIGR04042 family)
MPEMRFVIAWPDGREETCYSPSLVIRDYFVEGQDYPLPEFLERSRTALNIASDRVMAKYGFACSAALDQLARLEAAAEDFSDLPGASVRCTRFLPDGAQR